MSKWSVFFVGFLLNLSACSDATNMDLTPTSLDLGNMKIFVTQRTFTGDLGGILGADARCNSDPFRPPGNYKALLVDGVHRAAIPQVDWALRPTTLYFRGDGLTIVGETNAVGLFPFPVTEAISDSTQLVWTGLNGAGRDWSTANLNCQNWTVGDATANSTPGDVSSADDHMINAGISTFCHQSYHLICVQQ